VRARENPFCVERVLRFRYRFSGRGWDDLLARLAALRFRGAIVGAEGSGKTTLLEDLAGRLAPEGFGVRFVTLSAGQRTLTDAQRHLLLEGIGPDDFLFLDGADALSRLAWLRVRRGSRRARGLVVNAHREGLLATLHRTSTSPRLLADMIHSLTGRGADSFGGPAEDLFRRHRGNLRDALRELYDVCAARPNLASTTVPSP
jgi:hypothetical protein